MVPQPPPSPTLPEGAGAVEAGGAGGAGAETELPPTHACLHRPSSQETESSPPHLAHRCCAARTGGATSPSGGVGEGSLKRGWRSPPRRALPSKGRGGGGLRGCGEEEEAFIAENAGPRRPAMPLLLERSVPTDGRVLESRGRTRCASVGEQARIGRRSLRNKTAIDLFSRICPRFAFLLTKKLDHPFSPFFSFHLHSFSK